MITCRKIIRLTRKYYRSGSGKDSFIQAMIALLNTCDNTSICFTLINRRPFALIDTCGVEFNEKSAKKSSALRHSFPIEFPDRGTYPRFA